MTIVRPPRQVRKRARREWSANAQHGNRMAALNGLVQPGVLAFLIRHKLYRSRASHVAPSPRDSSVEAGVKPARPPRDAPTLD